MQPPTTNDGLEWGTLAQWVGPWVTSAVAILIALWGNFSRRDEQALDGLKNDIEGLSENVGELYQQDKKLNERMATVENEIKHLPTRDELHRIDTKITAIGATLDARFESISRQIGTLISQNERAQDRLAEREERSK